MFRDLKERNLLFSAGSDKIKLDILFSAFPNVTTIFCWNVQFSSVTQSCPTLCDPMNRSMPGLPVHHHLPEFTKTHPLSRWCHPVISSSVIPFSSCQSLPASESFPMSQLFTWGGQNIGVSALASVLRYIYIFIHPLGLVKFKTSFFILESFYLLFLWIFLS